MSMIKKIPIKFSETRELPDGYFKNEDDIFFDVLEGETLQVTAWFCYPSYDFIFGVPVSESPRAKNECAAMCLRYNTGKTFCTYLDRQELSDTIEALSHIQKNLK